MVLEQNSPKISLELKQTARGEWYIGSVSINVSTLEEAKSLLDSAVYLTQEKINSLKSGESTDNENTEKAKEKEEIILTPDEEKIFNKLKSLRFELSQKEGYPPYIIFHDSILKQLAKEKPVTEDSILKIIGEKKFEKYGKLFLREIFQSI
jgi:superfamily II DNA helicase RecQ